ncbi:MAG: septum formation initiator family protein [Eubacteriales bacterium]|nr:septum formation initiator family protein [Eubacteriales bacterium]
MALNNTKDRYNFIYGNRRNEFDTYGTSPRKLDVLPEPTPVKKEKPQPVVRTWETFDLRYTLMIIFAMVLLAVGALFYTKETARMNEMAHQIKVLKTEKAELQSRQVSIQSELDKAVNLDTIREYAEKNLHMIYPDRDNVIYYHQDSSDYFRQYESVDK